MTSYPSSSYIRTHPYASNQSRQRVPQSITTGTRQNPPNSILKQSNQKSTNNENKQPIFNNSYSIKPLQSKPLNSNYEYQSYLAGNNPNKSFHEFFLNFNFNFL